MQKFGEHTGVTSTDAHDDLTNVDTGDSAVGLTPGTTHTSLQSIGTSARQHLVDTDDVERVGADTQVETFLSGVLDQVLVAANTSGLEGLRAQLLIFVGDQVDAQREIVNVGTLTSKIEDSDLGVGDTAVKPRLRERLKKKTQNQYFYSTNFGTSTTARKKKRRRCCRVVMSQVLFFFCTVHRRPVFASHDREGSLFKSRDVDGGSKSSLGSRDIWSHLVLAVTVATSRTTSHLVGFCG